MSSSSSGDTNPNFWTSVVDTSELPTIQRCYDFCVSPECGAVTTFVGTTRSTFHGKIVTKLSYEAYVPMANKELIKLCRQCIAKFPSIVKIAAHHVIGECPVTQPSVVLACSSPHRRDALGGIEYLIDTLKAQIPIWKLEHYKGDDAVWKENIEWKQRSTSSQRSDGQASTGPSSSSPSSNDAMEPVRVMVRQEKTQEEG
mmetsp:Transcript_38719/g.93765  ORF Transcript_38719/g.93765 Transcript_38719/m.93765 type:complete len:200 (+) Transcript_38719:282-881(+)